jgi:hypothetical protein
MKHLRDRKILILQATDRYGERVLQGLGPHEYDRAASYTEGLLKPLP